MYVQAAINPNSLLRNGAYGIVMRGVQKCTRGCSSLRGRKRLPLCCIKLDTATDPCFGFGHILAYMFDVLMKIYESYGYTTREAALRDLLPLVQVAEALVQKYDVTTTNPPYMSVSNGGAKLIKYVQKNYEEGKTDFFAVFIQRCLRMTKTKGYAALITQHAWMFLGSFEKLRTYLSAYNITSMAHLGARAFEEISGEVVQTTSFVLNNSDISDYKGVYVRLVSGMGQTEKEEIFLSGKERYSAKEENYEKIPGKTICDYIDNTPIIQCFLQMLSPTLDYHEDSLGKASVVIKPNEEIEQLVERNIDLSRNDWDSFETPWDFQHHSLLRKVQTIAEAFDQWQTECDDRFNQLKDNEEELNRIFIDIYGLQDELTPEVEDKDVTVRKADLGRDIRSFISYAVGLFVEFVKTVYGADTLDENLKFIADALGGKGQPKDVIRNYFLNDFYADHCKIYQKRPIYWLFDSGKKNGFKALIYMHRYQPDIIARIRTDYVHEQQARYRTAIADLEQRIANASTGERVKLNKKLTALQAQDTEIRTYEEKIHHLADQMISIDLDDGVKKNYAIFQDVLAKIK